jgi:hypothetical protein
MARLVWPAVSQSYGRPKFAITILSSPGRNTWRASTLRHPRVCRQLPAAPLSAGRGAHTLLECAFEGGLGLIIHLGRHLRQLEGKRRADVRVTQARQPPVGDNVASGPAPTRAALCYAGLTTWVTAASTRPPGLSPICSI